MDALLENRPAEARALRATTTAYPIFVTRDLEAARRWLRRAGARTRIGLVASSHAARLRAYGIEMSMDFQGGVNWPNWFLDRPPSLEASNALEVAASEFKCQGLELDFVCVAWSWDMVRREGTWALRHLKARRLAWQPVTGERARYGLNAYRVLLTRARAGLVLWVPRGTTEDPTREPAAMDAIATYLEECGAKPLIGSTTESDGQSAPAAAPRSPVLT